MAAFYEHGNRPDPSKPNHYFDDALGDPYDCVGDHNHPTQSISPRVVEIAAFLVGVGVVLLILLGVYTLSDLVL